MERFLQLLLSWVWREPKIQSVLIVGSYARGTQHPSSDLGRISSRQTDRIFYHTGRFFMVQSIQQEA